eukprot:9374294-Prorocentrum_lima.AAC.1
MTSSLVGSEMCIRDSPGCILAYLPGWPSGLAPPPPFSASLPHPLPAWPLSSGRRRLLMSTRAPARS